MFRISLSAKQSPARRHAAVSPGWRLLFSGRISCRAPCSRLWTQCTGRRGSQPEGRGKKVQNLGSWSLISSARSGENLLKDLPCQKILKIHRPPPISWNVPKFLQYEQLANFWKSQWKIYDLQNAKNPLKIYIHYYVERITSEYTIGHIIPNLQLKTKLNKLSQN